LTKPLNEVIQPDDECLIAFERNVYQPDWCYSSHYRLSSLQQSRLYGHQLDAPIFNNRIILNWCIMAAPHHLQMKNALENFVKLLELEYIGLGAVKMQKFDVYSKHVYCTTGPFLFTATAREIVIQSSMGAPGKNASAAESGSGSMTSGPRLLTNMRLGSRDFIKEGALFKVINSNADTDHYTKVKDSNSFLSHQASQDVIISATKAFVSSAEMEGQVVMGRSKRNVYYLEKGTKRPVGGMDVFNAYNFSLVHIIHLSDFVMSLLPEGPELTMPKL
jgi:hypothetical protein